MRQTLISLLEPSIVALGYELVELEFNAHRGGGTLRIYIDLPGGETEADQQVGNHPASGHVPHPCVVLKKFRASADGRIPPPAGAPCRGCRIRAAAIRPEIGRAHV